MVSIFSDNDTEIVNNEKTKTMNLPVFFENLDFSEQVVISKAIDIINNGVIGRENRNIIEKYLDLTFGLSSNKNVKKLEYCSPYNNELLTFLYSKNQLTVKILEMYKILDIVKKQNKECMFKSDWNKIMDFHIIANNIKKQKYEYKNNEKLPFVDEIRPEAIHYSDNWEEKLEYKTKEPVFTKEELQQIRETLSNTYGYEFKKELLEKVKEKKENIDSTYNYKNKTDYNLDEIIQNVKQNAIALLTIDKHALPHLPFINEIIDENLELFCVHKEEKKNKEEICYTIAPYPFLDENQKWWKKNIIVFLLFTAPFIWKINNW